MVVLVFLGLVALVFLLEHLLELGLRGWRRLEQRRRRRERRRFQRIDGAELEQLIDRELEQWERDRRRRR
jgi:hypothetical protein